jgi:hypothetical protein
MTVLRGGYGVFYALDLQFTMYQLLAASAYPFTNLQIYQASPATPVRLAKPFPEGAQGVAPGAASPNGWEFKNRSPYQQQWNLTIARELKAGIGVEAAYAGNKGTHQSVAVNLNQTIRTAEGPLIPYAGYGRIIWQSLSGNSAYHALQVTARRHLGSNLSFRSTFTWSKAIDYASFGSAARQPQDPRDLRAERGLSDFHRGRTWTTDAVAVVPMGRGRMLGANLNRTFDLLLGGWRLSGILRLYDGSPFTPVVASANQQAGDPVRPDRMGPGTLSEASVSRWFNRADFAVVPRDAVRMGNSGRNILIGPGKLILDAALMKEVAIGGESRRLQFRLEAFNALNRANFGQPAPAIDVAAGAAISTADPGRQLQVASKFLF